MYEDAPEAGRTPAVEMNVTTYGEVRTRELLGHDPPSSANLSQSTRDFVYAAEGYIQPIILIFGFLTNIASAVVLRKVRMNEVFRICLLSLSVVDAITCAVGFVQLVAEVSYFGGDIPQGYMRTPIVAINALYYVYLMCMCASGTIVILIAVIRNFFVLKPMRARAYFTSHRTRLTCFLAFFMTFIIFIPVFLKVISQSCTHEENLPVCEWMDSTSPTLHRVAEVYVHYFLSALYGPVLILIYVICVICIRVTVKKSVKTLSIMTPRTPTITAGNNVKNISSAITNDARMRSRTAARITKTLLLILILDVICTLPYVIQGVGLLVAKGKAIFNDHGDAGMIYDVIVEIFLNLRPSYNFWLYVFQHPEFRVRVKSIVRRMCMPCYRSRCCPLCVLEGDPVTPLHSPIAWSLSTPGAGQSLPWFQRMSSRIQNGAKSDYLQVPLKQKSKTLGSAPSRTPPRKNSHSMDSDPDWSIMAQPTV